MNRNVVDGKWKQLSGSIKKHWGDLSDDDLVKLSGIFEQLVGFVQEKYGTSREKAENELHTRLNAWGERLSETADQSKTQVVTTAKDTRWSFVVPVIAGAVVFGLWLKSNKD